MEEEESFNLVLVHGQTYFEGLRFLESQTQDEESLLDILFDDQVKPKVASAYYDNKLVGQFQLEEQSPFDNLVDIEDLTEERQGLTFWLREDVYEDLKKTFH